MKKHNPTLTRVVPAVIAALALCASQAMAAITLLDSANIGLTRIVPATTAFTTANTTVSTGAKVLVVTLNYRSGSNRGVEPDALTWGTQTLTRAAAINNTAGTWRHSAIYYLYDPTPGTAPITGTWRTKPEACWVQIYTLTGVDTAGAPLVGTVNNGGATTVTCTVLGVKAGSWAAGAASFANNGGATAFAMTVSSGTVTDYAYLGPDNNSVLMASYASGLTAGDAAFTATETGTAGNQKMSFVVAVFADAAAPNLPTQWHNLPVSVSFEARDPGFPLTTGDVAGAVPVAGWNSVSGANDQYSGTKASLTDTTAGATYLTPVTLFYAGNDSWHSDGPTTTSDEIMMKGILKANPDSATDTGPHSRVELVLGNVPAGSYDLYVYLMENGLNAQVSVNLGATTYYVQQQANYPGYFLFAGSTTAGQYADANCALFEGVTPDANGVLRVICQKNAVDPELNDGIGVAGLQLAPTKTAQTACSITQNPAPVTAVVGADAAKVSVGVSGPCKVIWKKNGVVIPGAVAPSAAFPFTLADNGASIVAVVYNNVVTNTSPPVTLTVVPANKAIGLSFQGRSGGDTLLKRAMTAGVIAQINWNNSLDDGTFRGRVPLATADDIGTMLNLDFVGSDSWNSDGGTTTPDEKLMKGIIKCNPNPDTVPTGDTEKMFFTISNVPSGTYSVVIYTIENGAGAKIAFNIGATTYFVAEQNVFAGAFIRSTDILGNYDQVGNYVQFDGVSPVGGAIAITGTKLIEDPQVTDGAGVAGIQLIQTSGSDFPINTQPIVVVTDPVGVQSGSAR